MSSELAVYGQSVCLNLGNYLDPIPILTNLHLTIPKGCIYGLIGPSGCGKTTLQKCIMGVYKPDYGVISVFGSTPGSSGSTVPGPSVGYMPQEIALDSELTVREQLTFLGRINNLTIELINSRIDEITSTLDIVGLDKRSGQFSGGQQRRISLACTLIHQPSLYLLDEPTVGCDIVLVHKIWNYLKHLRDSTGATIIISTHYIEEVNSADLFGFMSNGKIVIQDSPTGFSATSQTRTLEEAILKEYIRIYNLSDKERKKSKLFLEFPQEEKSPFFGSITKWFGKSVKFDSRSNSSFVPKKSEATFRSSVNFPRFILFLIWRYLLRWKVLMAIPFVLFIILSFTGCLVLFLVYGLPMKQLTLGVVNYGKESNYLNNITNYLSIVNLLSIPDEIIARQATENGTTTAYIVVPDNWDDYLDQRLVSLFSNDLYSASVKLSQIKLFQDTTHIGKVLTIQTQLFRAVDSLIKNVTIDLKMNPRDYEFFETQPIFESPDGPNILAPKFIFVIRLYLFFLEAFTMFLLTAWFRYESKETVHERLISLGVKTYHLLASLFIVATFCLTIPFICIFASFVVILGLPSPSSWSAVVLTTISVVISGICRSRLIGVYVKSIIGCVTLLNAYTTYLWLLGCVAWPYEGLPYFMDPLTIMIPHLDPGTSLIRMTLYGDSIWTPQVYHGVGVAAIWMVIHLLITFITANQQ